MWTVHQPMVPCLYAMEFAHQNLSLLNTTDTHLYQQPTIKTYSTIHSLDFHIVIYPTATAWHGTDYKIYL